MAEAGCREAARVFTALETLGTAVQWLDTAAFPAATAATLDPEGFTWAGTPMPRPGCVYVRSLGVNPRLAAHDQDRADRPWGLLAQMDEKRAFLLSLMKIWQDAGTNLVNTPEANAQHGQKPHQLRMIAAAGVPVPPWVATSDGDAVRQFVARVGDAVYKPLSGGATVRRVEPADLADHRLAALATAPVLFQAYVPGVPVRAFAVGRRIAAAAEIHSPELDYRRGETEVVPTALTPGERKAVLAAARACRMAFTGVDFIRSPDGPAVLECNPSPMFAVFEEKTGRDVAGPLARYLLQCSRRAGQRTT